MNIKRLPTLNEKEIMELKLAILVLNKYSIPASTGVENVLKQKIQDRGGKV